MRAYTITPLSERFAKGYVVDDSTGCWVWRKGKNNHGYGMISEYSPDRTRNCMKLAHRVAYQLHVGSIPEGKVLDHLCRNPACCNPDHLEPVTQKVNLVRGVWPKKPLDACRNGHAMTGANLILAEYAGRGGRKGIKRVCRQCGRDKALRHYRKKTSAGDAHV